MAKNRQNDPEKLRRFAPLSKILKAYKVTVIRMRQENRPMEWRIQEHKTLHV